MTRSLTARLLPILLLGGLACPAPKPVGFGDGPASAADQPAVTQLEERLRRAIVAADTATLALLWAPEYQSTSAVGHTTNRAEALMAYGSGLVKVDTAVTRDVEVRTYGSTAVSVGSMDWAGTAAGRPFGGTVRFQHVWVLRGGAWRLVASQLTSQPSP